jgi:hypothetical protein
LHFKVAPSPDGQDIKRQFDEKKGLLTQSMELYENINKEMYRAQKLDLDEVEAARLAQQHLPQADKELHRRLIDGELQFVSAVNNIDKESAGFSDVKMRTGYKAGWIRFRYYTGWDNDIKNTLEIQFTDDENLKLREATHDEYRKLKYGGISENNGR